MSLRIWLAFLIAPVAAVLTLASLGAIWFISRDEPAGDTAAGAVHPSFFFAVVGLPVGYAVELVVGLPLFLVLRERRQLSVGSIVAVATFAGAAAMPFVWRWVWGGGFELAMVLVGAAMGAASGATFAIVGLSRSNSRPAI